MYDEVFEAWKKEMRSSELQPLKPDFFKDVAGHIRRVKEAQRNLDPKSLKGGILNEEEKRLEQLVRQLVSKRLEKMTVAARHNQPVSVTVPEKWMLDQLVELSHHVERFETDVTHGSEPSAMPEPPKERTLLRFLKDVPAIMGVDLRTHGPFLKEDVADLPSENAISLIRQGAAVEIRTRIETNVQA